MSLGLKSMSIETFDRRRNHMLKGDKIYIIIM